MATTTSTRSPLGRSDTALRTGAGLMTLAGIGFIGYGVIFFVRNPVAGGQQQHRQVVAVARSRRQASRPSTLGTSTSSSTASGRCRPTCSSASAPSPATS